MTTILRVENVPEEVASRREARARKSPSSSERIPEKGTAQEDRPTPEETIKSNRAVQFRPPTKPVAFVGQNRDALVVDISSPSAVRFGEEHPEAQNVSFIGLFGPEDGLRKIASAMGKDSHWAISSDTENFNTHS